MIEKIEAAPPKGLDEAPGAFRPPAPSEESERPTLRLEELRGQAERAQRDGNFEVASRLLYADIPAAEAELSEARGDRPAAARYYLRFAELWAGADAERQPRVADARRRAAALLRTRRPKR